VDGEISQDETQYASLLMCGFCDMLVKSKCIEEVCWGIQYILISERDITLTRYVVISKNIIIMELDLDIHKIHLHTTHLTFCSQIIIQKPNFSKYEIQKGPKLW